MKFADILQKIIDNDSFEKDPMNDVEELTRALNIETYNSWWHIDEEIRKEFQSRFKTAYIRKHLCSDTWVGTIAYWFEDQYIGYSTQSARKSDMEFTFDKNAEYKTIKLRNELKKLFDMDNEINFTDESETADDDLGKGYSVDYGSQLLTKTVCRKSNDEKLSVIGIIPYDYANGARNEERLRVRPMYSNGDCGPEETLLLSDVYIPWAE